METQTIFCPHCQTSNPVKNLYCLACGKPLILPAPVQDQVGPPIQAPSVPISYTQAPSSQSAPVQLQGYPTQGLPPQQVVPGVPQSDLPPQGFQPQNVPAQPGYYPPPPPSPAPVVTAPSLEKLGARKEDWLRLVSGRADAAEKVQKTFVDELQSCAIPMVTVEKVEFSAGFSKKVFQLVRHPAGSIVVAVDPVGKDLTLSWALYVPQIPKWTMLGILAGIAFAVSFLTSLGTVGNFGYFFVSWVFGTFRWLLDVAVLALIAGYVWKGTFWYFFMDSPNEIAKETLFALKLAVQQSLRNAAEKAGIETKNI